MAFAGQIEATFALGFKEQLHLLLTGPELEHQGAGTGLDDLVEPASGELLIELNRHCLKEYTVHNGQIRACRYGTASCLCIFIQRGNLSLKISYHIGIRNIDVMMRANKTDKATIFYGK
jgi:hypothetical protein